MVGACDAEKLLQYKYSGHEKLETSEKKYLKVGPRKGCCDRRT